MAQYRIIKTKNDEYFAQKKVPYGWQDICCRGFNSLDRAKKYIDLYNFDQDFKEIITYTPKGAEK